MTLRKARWRMIKLRMMMSGNDDDDDDVEEDEDDSEDADVGAEDRSQDRKT